MSIWFDVLHIVEASSYREILSDLVVELTGRCYIQIKLILVINGTGQGIDDEDA
jgi:hypothetical protein